MRGHALGDDGRGGLVGHEHADGGGGGGGGGRRRRTGGLGVAMAAPATEYVQHFLDFYLNVQNFVRFC